MKNRYALRYELQDGTLESDVVLSKNSKRDALRAARCMSKWAIFGAVALWVDDELKESGVKRFSLPSWESVYGH